MIKGVWQLKTLTLRYCEHGGSSKGLRELINSPALEAFVNGNRNDKLEVKVEPHNGKHPTIVGTYLNGRVRDVCVRNQNPDEIKEVCQTLCDNRGHKVRKLRNTDFHVPARAPLQGPWTSNVRILSEQEYTQYLHGLNV